MASNYNIYSKVMIDEEEQQISRINIDRWIFGLLLLVIGLTPLLIGGYAKEVVSPLITNIPLMSSGVKVDMFTHYKMIVLIAITVVVIAMLLMKIIFLNGEIQKTKINYFLGLFVIAIVISTILSPTISVALWGQYNRSDGAISYICYLALFFVAINISYPQKAFHYVMYIFYPFVFINLVLITMNFFGHDAAGYPIVEKMMTLFLPENSSTGEGAILLGTLNQWNYMSGMFAIMTVMYLAWTIVDKNKVRSFVNVGVSVVALSIMFMSLSTSGFLTLLLITPLLIWVAIKSTNRKRAIIALCTFVIVGIPVFHVLAEKNPRVWDESIGFVIKKNPYIQEQPVAMVTPNFNVSIGNKAYAADNSFELPILPESGISAGSGRTYIWGKTIELTIERPLFGFGLDTIMYNFPHYSIDVRAGMGDENIIVDKPHNMYIGIFYGTGIIGFIGFAGFVILTALIALKAVITRKQALATVFGITWLAFLIQALFNDTLPGTAAPMWTIAGMMMSFMLRNKEVGEITNGRNN